MITIKLEGLKEALETFDPQNVRKAARSALDRVTKSGKSVASEEIRKRYNVKRSDLDGRIRITPPRMSDLVGIITITGKGMSLSYFGARQLTRSRILSRSGKQIGSKGISRAMRKAGPLPQGVVVQVMKGKDTVLLRNAFLAKTKSGHIGVFRRSGKKHLPIYEKNVISVASMAENANVMPNVIKRIQERWQVEFPSQLDYYLGRRGR